MSVLLIIIGVMSAVVFWGVSVYNRLIQLKILVQNSFSDIDVHLKKRHDLIPNLIETVKGYMSHEKETLESVISARNKAVGASDPESQIEAENALSALIPKIFALSEAYPDLKASPQFLDLQDQLQVLEAEIANARKYYNAVVRDFNTKQQVFPDAIIAGMFKFEQKKFFEAAADEKAAPKVSF